MESLKEFLDSLIRATRERFLNPLYVAFIVSWLIVNYEVVLILLGSDNAAEKIRFIDEVLFPQEKDVVINGILRPLAAAASYVLLSPYIYRAVMKYARDFPGYGPKERHFLVERGLSKAELELLHRIRNTPVLTVNRLMEKQQFDFNEAKTTLDLFERMSLLESKQYRDQGRPVLGYALTGLARMALMAAKSRGLLPTSEG